MPKLTGSIDGFLNLNKIASQLPSLIATDLDGFRSTDFFFGQLFLTRGLLILVKSS